jgi:hypothetical protein
MALLALAGVVGGAGLGVGAISSFNAKRARSKALLADAEAQQEAGVVESADRLREGRRAQGAGAVAAGASGFTLEGSSVDVLSQMAAEASTSASRARWEASRQSARVKNDARQAKAGSVFGLTKDLLGAGAKVAGGIING